MFIPRDKPVYTNMATTYVLVDALVADLCEGGFSGIVEIILRDTDAQILISAGKVVGVLEQRGLDGKTGELNRRQYSSASVPEVAARSRYERGRVSVYSCSAETALAVAGLAGGEQLYAQLSTEFADLQRMISKLSRERDRQWFIELSLADGTSALIHLRNDRCRIISSSPEAGELESESSELVNNPTLLAILEACSRVGGTFDVYFRDVRDDVTPMDVAVAPMPFADSFTSPAPTAAREEEAHAAAASQHAGPVTSASDSLTSDPIPPSAHELAEARLETLRRPAAEEEPIAAAIEQPVWEPVLTEEPLDELIADQNAVEVDETRAPHQVAASADSTAPTVAPPAPGAPGQTGGLSAIRNEVQASTDFTELTETQIMTEVKRLLGEIARTIEDAARAIEQRDTFSIYLRAGQLKVADRYPFLDPFGAEFEYLSGEIAFIGNAAPWEFIEGLTEALKLAVEGVAQTSSQGPRIRAQVAEDLNRLLERNRAAFIEYGLDGSIEQILSV